MEPVEKNTLKERESLNNRLYKMTSGVLIDDKFDVISTDYLVNDAAHVGITQDGLRLTHSAVRDVRVLRDIPLDTGAVEVFVDYTPVLQHDQAGFLLFDNASQTAQLLEYQDDNGLDPLENIKVTKNGDVFDFFMKHNTFLHVDSVEYPFKKMGFIAKKGQSDFEPFIVNRFICTTSTDFTVRNLEEGFSVALESMDGLQRHEAVSDESGAVVFVFEHLVLDGTLVIYEENGVELERITTEFFAGDVYNFGSYLVIRKDGTELSKLTPTELGRIAREPIDVLLEVYNPTTTTALALELRVNKKDTLFGYEWADVAWDESGVPSAFGDVITVDALGSDESKFFWLKLERTSATTNESVFHFYIDLHHQ